MQSRTPHLRYVLSLLFLAVVLIGFASAGQADEGEETTVTAEQCNQQWGWSSAKWSCPSQHTTITASDDNRCAIKTKCKDGSWAQNLIDNSKIVDLGDVSELSNCDGVLKIGSC